MSEFKLFDNKEEVVKISEIHKAVDSALIKVVTKTISFDGTSGNGAVGTTKIFDVAGIVAGYVFGVCTEDLAGDSATISVGVENATTGLIAQTTATNIDNGEIWVDSSPSVLEAVPSMQIIKSDIIATIGTANITDGTITFYCVYYPIGVGIVF